MSILVEHAAELARDGVATIVEVTITRRARAAAAEVAPRCGECGHLPAALDVVAELVALDPAHRPAEGATLGRVERALCDSCLSRLAPGLSRGLALAASSGRELGVPNLLAAGLVRRLGALPSQMAMAHVRLFVESAEGMPEVDLDDISADDGWASALDSSEEGRAILRDFYQALPEHARLEYDLRYGSPDLYGGGGSTPPGGGP